MEERWGVCLAKPARDAMWVRLLASLVRSNPRGRSSRCSWTRRSASGSRPRDHAAGTGGILHFGLGCLRATLAPLCYGGSSEGRGPGGTCPPWLGVSLTEGVVGQGAAPVCRRRVREGLRSRRAAGLPKHPARDEVQPTFDLGRELRDVRSATAACTCHGRLLAPRDWRPCESGGLRVRSCWLGSTLAAPRPRGWSTSRASAGETPRGCRSTTCPPGRRSRPSAPPALLSLLDMFCLVGGSTVAELLSEGGSALLPAVTGFGVPCSVCEHSRHPAIGTRRQFPPVSDSRRSAREAAARPSAVSAPRARLRRRRRSPRLEERGRLCSSLCLAKLQRCCVPMRPCSLSKPPPFVCS